MARLIDDLLSLSRIELDEHVVPSDSVDLSHVVDGVVEALSLAAHDREPRRVADVGRDGGAGLHVTRAVHLHDRPDRAAGQVGDADVEAQCGFGARIARQ